MNASSSRENTHNVVSGLVDPSAVCVVGTGPVGLAYALRLADAGTPVTLVDSGNFEPPDQRWNFFDGSIASAAAANDRTDDQLVAGTGTLYSARGYMTDSRFLGSGGNSQRWGVLWRPSATIGRVRIVAGDRADFKARPEFDIPAWEGGEGAVFDRYEDALAFFDLADHSFDSQRYQDRHLPLDVAESGLPAKLFHFARAAAITEDRLREVREHPGIDVRSDLHLVRIETEGNSRVTGLVFADKNRAEVRLVARHYVLALGGIENARQMLLAKEDGSVTDRHDVFGRWFMDHPHARLGYLTSADPDALIDRARWYDFQEVDGTPIMRGHELDPKKARELELLRFSIDLVGRPRGDASKAGVALAGAWDATKRRNLREALGFAPALLKSPLDTFRLLQATRASDVHNTGKGGWSDPNDRFHDCDSVSVEAMFEQRPSPDNRIRLGQRRDRLGRRLPVLQWSWSRCEVDSINRSQEFVADAFNRSGTGRFVTMTQLGQAEVPRAGSGYHHLGGTRQSADAADGVVDAQNRVHGIENLSLIGSSIFPNSVGYANPTLTAVADAIRVADAFVGSDVDTRSPKVAQG